jgi:hypothetical protein
MFSTSLATAAVAGFLASGSLATQPTWQTDYRKALAQAVEQQKPVAVFIARGGAGYSRLVTEGGLGADAAQMLRKNYVCLYVDTGTARGKELAGAFQISEGLVISDKTGGVQALRHEGRVSQTDLTRYLTRFVKAERVAQTEFRGATQPLAQPATIAYQPVYQPQPVYRPQPTFNPVMNFRNFIGGG